ncbi:MAG TPA: 4-hydroxy-tetrahydrodipicolinate reductase [Rhodanobacteraceae bacterium]|nr:4-hydroxy-tetrahydrodipicolinate reductase [Rhodanobacteraceae bacterium]
MSKPTRLGINGANGRMGRALQALLRNDARFALTAMVTTSDEWRNVPKLDVVIDFSTPAGFDAALAHCRPHEIAFVCGTTGLDAGQRAKLQEAARDIPVLYAANFSLGIAVLTKLLRDAASALPDWDLEIIEAHHARKVDAPSGTALALGRAAASARGQDFDEVADFARHGHTGARKNGAIGFASIRAGEIVGEHTALLATRDERIELTHRAYDNTIFARGALHAAAWLAGKPAGTYSLDDVLRP